MGGRAGTDREIRVDNNHIVGPVDGASSGARVGHVSNQRELSVVIRVERRCEADIHPPACTDPQDGRLRVARVPGVQPSAHCMRHRVVVLQPAQLLFTHGYAIVRREEGVRAATEEADPHDEAFGVQHEGPHRGVVACEPTRLQLGGERAARLFGLALRRQQRFAGDRGKLGLEIWRRRGWVRRPLERHLTRSAAAGGEAHVLKPYFKAALVAAPGLRHGHLGSTAV